MKITKSTRWFFTAFTLAEVLITLSIIGVIAAITIPTLIDAYQKQETVTQLEKIYSSLQNVIRRSEVDNGPIADWDFVTNANTITGNHNFFDIYLKPYLVNSSFCSDGNNDGTFLDPVCGLEVSVAGTNYMLNNGTAISIKLAPNLLYIVIDLNNAKPPNKYGRDGFYFTLDSTNGLIPYGYTKGMTRDQIISSGSQKCDSNNQEMCAALILYDGWKISDDYPW